jgi:hypothetical protein
MIVSGEWPTSSLARIYLSVVGKIWKQNKKISTKLHFGTGFIGCTVYT